MLDSDSTGRPKLELAPVSERMAHALAEAVTIAVATLPGNDLVAVGLVYSSFDPDDDTPSPVDLAACSRARRNGILAEHPPPDGLVYVWSDSEFDVHPTQDAYARHLAMIWRDVYQLGRSSEDAIESRPDELDFDWVPRSALIAACRHLNQGHWSPARPGQLADDAVVFPAGRGGVDPDTGDNLRAVLTQTQQRQLATLLPL